MDRETRDIADNSTDSCHYESGNDRTMDRETRDIADNSTDSYHSEIPSDKELEFGESFLSFMTRIKEELSKTELMMNNGFLNQQFQHTIDALEERLAELKKKIHQPNEAQSTESNLAATPNETEYDSDEGTLPCWRAPQYYLNLLIKQMDKSCVVPEEPRPLLTPEQIVEKKLKDTEV